MHELDLSISAEGPREAKAVAKAISPKQKEGRTRVSISAEGNAVRLRARAADRSAMRSVINSYVRLIYSCLKCLEQARGVMK